MWRKNKFNRKRVEKAGLKFDSKAESSVHDMLLMRQKSEEIKITGIHVHTIIEPLSKIKWIADFECLDLFTQDTFYVECKGFETPEWRLKLRLIRAHFPYKVEIWKVNSNGPFLHELVKPAFPVLRAA